MNTKNNLLSFAIVASLIAFMLAVAVLAACGRAAKTPAGTTATSPAPSPQSTVAPSPAVPSTSPPTPAAPSQVTLEEANKALGIVVPVPAYLPGGYAVKRILLDGGVVRFFLSDTDLPSGAEGQAPLEYSVKWGPQGIPGGLKIPGERVTIGEAPGVMWEQPNQNQLWWQPHLEPGSREMFEMVISASKQIPQDELLKMARSVPIPTREEIENAPNGGSGLSPTPGPPPQTAVTAHVGQTATVNGTTIILEEISQTNDGFTVTALYPRGTVPSSFLPGAFAEYSVDSGPFTPLVSPPPFSLSENGIEYTWLSEERLPAGAKELGVRITRVGQQTGPWEFRFALPPMEGPFPTQPLADSAPAQ